MKQPVNYLKVFNRRKAIIFNHLGIPVNAFISDEVKELNKWIKDQQALDSALEVKDAE